MNLLQNALKFTHPHTKVTLNAYAVNDRVSIDVSDNCGGLPRGSAEKMFSPFIQRGEDKRGWVYPSHDDMSKLTEAH